MDRFGIAGTLVTDSVSRCTDPAWGNRAVSEATADEDRLVPAWVLLPSATAETPSPERLVDAMREAGVRAAFLCPGTYGHGLEDWEVDDLLEPLAEAGVPLFLDGEGGLPGWGYAYALDSLDVDGAVRLARRHPRLPVVLTAFRFRHTQRRVCRAMQAVPNLYMELSGWWFYKNVELLAELVGPERLLFGTRLPVHGPAATKATVQYADLDTGAIELIAGGNLRRLLSWDGELPEVTPDSNPPERGRELHAAAMRRADLHDLGILDCHGHLGRSAAYHVPRWRPEQLIAEMDRLGVGTVCVFPFGGQGGRDAEANDRVLAAQRRYPDRLVGFACADDRRTPEDYEAELRRCITAGLRGIKTFASDRELQEVTCRIAHEERLLAVDHNWGSPENLLELARAHPDAVLITGHTQDDYGDVFRQADNVYMGTCPLIEFGATERYVRTYGADRLLFGSDMSDLPQAWGFGPILYAEVSDADKRAILGGNLRRLLQTHSRPRG
jgi:predicted TIM-barrel fold metal-dependent hydrolase